MSTVIKLWDNEITIHSPTHFEKIHKGTKKPHKMAQNANGPRGTLQIFLMNDNKVRKYFLVHRIMYLSTHEGWDILLEPMKNQIDHVDRTPSTNDVSNLRLVTHQENQFNTNAKGCSQRKNGRWQAYINLNKKRKNLGTYDTEEFAHNAYLAEKARLHVILGH